MQILRVKGKQTVCLSLPYLHVALELLTLLIHRSRFLLQVCGNEGPTQAQRIVLVAPGQILQTDKTICIYYFNRCFCEK